MTKAIDNTLNNKQLDWRQSRIELLAATWLSYAGFYFCRKIFGVVKGPLKETLGTDDLHVSHLWTAWLVAYMLGQFATAKLTGQISIRRLLLAGMITSFVTNALFGLLVTAGGAPYGLLLTLMAIHGAAQATGWAGNCGLIANWTRSSERGMLMGIWGTCYQIGSIGAKAFAAFLFGWLGLLAAFWGGSLVLAAVVLLFYFWGRESPEDAGFPPLEEEAPLIRQKNDRSLSLMAGLMGMGAIYFTLKFTRYALESWSALLLREHFHLSVEVAGYLSTAFDQVGFLGVLIAGYFADRLGPARRGSLIFGLTTLCLFASIFIATMGLRSPYLFVVGLGLVGFTLMGPDSMIAGVSAMDVGSRRWALTAVAVVNGLGSLGPIVQEPLIGWLRTQGRDEAVLWTMVAMMAVATLGTALLTWRLRPRNAG